MAVTSEQDNFSNVSGSWSEHIQEQAEGPVPPAEDLGHTMDGTGTGADHEPHRLGSERLECIVDTPIKENDGTKDAFVSYLITTSVRIDSQDSI